MDHNSTASTDQHYCMQWNSIDAATWIGLLATTNGILQPYGHKDCVQNRKEKQGSPYYHATTLADRWGIRRNTATSNPNWKKAPGWTKFEQFNAQLHTVLSKHCQRLVCCKTCFRCNTWCCRKENSSESRKLDSKWLGDNSNSKFCEDPYGLDGINLFTWHLEWFRKCTINFTMQSIVV